LIPKANQHYETEHICDQNWVKFPSLVFEIWCSQCSRVIACCDLDLWPFDPISMSQAHVHTWPDFGEICSNIYEDIVFTRFFGSLVTRITRTTASFNLWSQKLTSTSTNPTTYVTKIGWNSLHWFLRHGVHNVFGTHRHTHSQTDKPECAMPPVPFFNCHGGIKFRKFVKSARWTTRAISCWSVLLRCVDIATLLLGLSTVSDATLRYLSWIRN